MNIRSFSIVKNESDIIETFIRHNVRFVDHMHIIDNASTDNTASIISRLTREGLPITLEYNYEFNHPQVGAVNSHLKSLKGRAPDFMFLLDADEFISVETKNKLYAILNDLPEGGVGFVKWIYYVPTPHDNQFEVNPIRRMRHCCEPENAYHKVVLPKSVLDNERFYVTPGNHNCISLGSPPLKYSHVAEISLAHFPVRSAEQFTSKIIVGKWALSTRNYLSPNEGLYWRRLHSRLMKGHKLKPEELEYIAANYGDTMPNENYKLQEKPLNSESDFELRYTELVNINPVNNAITYADSYFSKLNKTALSNGDVSINKTLYGLIAYQRSDTVIGRSIDLYGEWAAGEIKYLKNLIRPGDRVVDIGANIGTHTIPFSHFVGKEGSVIAFEPQRISYQLLCANAVLNNRYNVNTINSAVGNKLGTVRVPVCYGGNIANVGHKQWGQGESTNLVTLDTYNYSPVNLIKISVEGMEREVIEGAVQTINKHKPVIYVENHIEENSSALIQTLFDLGYRCWWFFEPYYNSRNLYGNKTNIFANVSRPVVNMICTHQALNLAVDGYVEVINPDDKWQAAWDLQKQKHA